MAYIVPVYFSSKFPLMFLVSSEVKVIQMKGEPNAVEADQEINSEQQCLTQKYGKTSIVILIISTAAPASTTAIYLRYRTWCPKRKTKLYPRHDMIECGPPVTILLDWI